MKLDQLWGATLGEIKSGPGGTRALFDAVLRDSTAVHQNGTFVVSVVNYDLDTLASIQPIIERTMSRLAGRQIGVEFVRAVSADSEQPTTFAPAQSIVPEYDVHVAGWFPVSEYECRFWAPYLGRIAWRIWEIVRRADKRKVKTEWTPRRRWSAPELAEMVPCGRQAVTGVSRVCAPGDLGAIQGQDGLWRRHNAGAFDRLRDSGVAVIARQGERRHTSYWIVVKVQLGLLSGDCISTLPARLQVQHDRWLEAHGFDPVEWDVSIDV